MKHSVYGKKLGRNRNQRTALFRSLVRALFTHGSIETTAAKAKAIKGLVDKLITKGKQSSVSANRVVESFLVHPDLISKLLTEIAPSYQNRTSGFTTIVRLGTRAGDGAMMVRMSLSEGVAVAKKEPPKAASLTDKVKAVKTQRRKAS